jgi:hypothetical protein
MRFRKIAATLALTLTASLGGCSDLGTGGEPGPVFPPAPETLTAVVSGNDQTPTFRRGEDIPVVLLNRTSEQAVMGELSCTADVEKLDRSGENWVRLSHLRACIEIARTVFAGGDFPFELPTPGRSGIFRVVFEAYAGTHGQVSVRSNQFRVR